MTEDPYKTVEPAPFLWLEQVLHATVHIGAMAYGSSQSLSPLSLLALMYVILRGSAGYCLPRGL